MSETEIKPYVWYDCNENNYWSEPESEYITIVAFSIETWDDKNDKVNKEVYYYTQNDCPYGWTTLSRDGGKFMLIKKI